MVPTVASIAQLVRLVFHRFEEDGCVQVAGNLTFTTLLALVPLVAIAVTLIAAFPAFEDWANEIKIFILLNFVPESGGKIITGYMQQFADNATRLTALGAIFLGVTALTLVVTIEKVFNVIWRVRFARPLLQRLVTYWVAITVGPVLIGASLSITSWLLSYSLGIANSLPGGDSILLGMVPPALNAAAFAFLYRTLPNRRIRALDALAGGVVAAAAFELMRPAFGLYVTSVPTFAAVYGTFASVPIFLLWIYLSWMVVLFGAVVAAVLPRWRSREAPGEAALGGRLFRAFRVLRALGDARARGVALTLPDVARAAELAEDDAEEVLVRLDEQRWAGRTLTGHWVLTRALDTLSLAEVYRAYVFRASPDPSSTSALDVPLHRVAAIVTSEIDGGMNRSVASLLAPDAASSGSGTA